MFACMPEVKTVTIGSGVTDWGTRLFNSMNIEKVTVTSAAFDIGALSYQMYSTGGAGNSIKELVLENPALEVTNAAEGPLALNIEKVVLNVRSLADYSFAGAPVTTLEIRHVEEIGDSAFQDCVNLTGDIAVSYTHLTLPTT